jgi:hypothetical protein
MRLRGASNGETIYEFFNGNGGATPTPAGDTVCFGVKSISCSSGQLLVVMADSGGCLNCTSGLAFYSLGQTTIPSATATPVPNNWSLIMGDLTDCGLEIDGATFKNNWGSEINLKVTIQYMWSPAVTATTVQNRSAYVVRNGDVSDIPVANFISQANGFTSQVAVNFIKLQNGEYFQPWAYQSSGGDLTIGTTGATVPTTLLVERYCA